MSTKTKTSTPGRCDCCGKPTTMRDEYDRCPGCQVDHYQADLYAGEVIEKVLGDAVAAAREYLAPSDVHEIVARAVKRAGCDGAMTLAVAQERSRRAAREAWRHDGRARTLGSGWRQPRCNARLSGSFLAHS